MTYYLNECNNDSANIQKFIENIKKLDFSFVSPCREIRRNPDGPLVKNISKKKIPHFY